VRHSPFAGDRRHRRRPATIAVGRPLGELLGLSLGRPIVHDPTATERDPREEVSANRNSPRREEYSRNIPSVYDFRIKTQILCENCKIHIFCFVTQNFANDIPLDLEKCKLFFCSISFIFYRTKFLSNLKLL
jgi:hypothetical protein